MTIQGVRGRGRAFVVTLNYIRALDREAEENNVEMHFVVPTQKRKELIEKQYKPKHIKIIVV